MTIARQTPILKSEISEGKGGGVMAASRIGIPVILLLVTSPGWGQLGRGTISGTVVDQQGAVVTGVSVTILNTGTNAVFRSRTNDQGFYTAPGLVIGDYQVIAEAPGFKRALRTGVSLQVDQRAQVDLQLEVGAVVEQVEVVGEAPLVDTGSAVVGKVIENRRVVDLPINGRSAMALMLLAPSVKSNAGPTNSGFSDRGIQISSVSINGGPNAMNNFMLDGGNNNQSYVGEININPAVDSVEEFKVQTGTMSAEFGYTAGGVVNIVSKSGTNQVHGALYEFLRNDKLDARNTFDRSKAPFRYNQYGGAAGGPVIRDRTFYFANYEEWKLRRTTNPITTMPTVQERAGDFSALRQTNGSLIPIFDPATTRANPSGAGFVRDLFPNNAVPPNRFDPVARNLFPFFPLPNRTPSDPFTNANNYTNPTSSTIRSMRQYLGKGDHRFSDRNSLSFRYAYFQHKTGGPDTSPYPDPLVSRRDDDVQNRNAVLTDIHTFSPRVINEFRAGFARDYFPFIAWSFSGSPPGGGAVAGGWPAKVGLPPSVPFDTMPIVSITGIPAFRSGSAGVRGLITWTFVDMVTYIRSNHALKLGGEVQIRRGNNFQRSSPSGSFTFTSALTGNPQIPAGTGAGFATYLLGTVSNASATSHIGEAEHGYATSFFVQDDWKINRHLTLNLGLRHDYQQWPRERYNGLSNFNPFATDPRSGLPGRTEFAGVDYGRSAMEPDRNDWGPRFGFAYDLFGKGRTVLRGGYGIYYPMIFYRDNFGSTAGFASTSTTYLPPGGNANFPAFQLKDGFPSPVILPQGSALGPSAFLGQNATWDESNSRVPRSQQWNLSIQQQIFGAWLLDVTYLGNRGTHFPAGAYDYNQLDPQFNSLGLALQQQVPNPNAGRVPGSLGAATITRAQSLRPFPHYNTISVRNPHQGNFNYHALALSVEKRFSRGVVMLVSYTAAKGISDGVRTPVDFGPVEQTNENGYQNGKFDRRAERSLDPTDVAQRLVVSGIYELPFGGGRRVRSSSRLLHTIIGGWQVDTIVTVQSGLPLIVRGANNFLANRPDSTGRSAKLDDRGVDRWFDTTQFVNPPNFTYGNVGRVLPDVRTPGAVNFDLSLIKNTSVTERWRLQFRAEAFNAFNQVNLMAPNATFQPGPDGRNRSGAFGVITGARDARIIQFGMKLVF